MTEPEPWPPAHHPHLPPGLAYISPFVKGKPPSNIGWAVASMVLFWPTGVASLLYALKVDDLWARGEVAAATAASRKARTYGVIGTVFGTVVVGLGIVTFVAFFPARP